MPRLLLTAAAAAIAMCLPASATTTLPGLSTDTVLTSGPVTEFDRKGRKGRSKPRIPGGSGCDDPGDILEHPECAG